MTIREGEKLRNNFNGRVYRVQAIRNKLVVLDAVEDSSWIITEKDIVGIFYTKIGTREQETPFGSRSTFAPESSERP